MANRLCTILFAVIVSDTESNLTISLTFLGTDLITISEL